MIHRKKFTSMLCYSVIKMGKIGNDRDLGNKINFYISVWNTVCILWTLKLNYQKTRMVRKIITFAKSVLYIVILATQEKNVCMYVWVRTCLWTFGWGYNQNGDGYFLFGAIMCHLFPSS